ncbi:MAG: hypothetical protein M1833_001193 [Piccolia ochrophora]|nr:MAG: hypothetical protein M1833_001193 [Piccolia ochrophora]
MSLPTLPQLKRWSKESKDPMAEYTAWRRNFRAMSSSNPPRLKQLFNEAEYRWMDNKLATVRGFPTNFPEIAAEFKSTFWWKEEDEALESKLRYAVLVEKMEEVIKEVAELGEVLQRSDWKDDAGWRSMEELLLPITQRECEKDTKQQ